MLSGASVGSVVAADGHHPHAVAGRRFRPDRGGRELAGAVRRWPRRRVRHTVGAAGAGRRPHGDGTGPRSVGRHSGPAPLHGGRPRAAGRRRSPPGLRRAGRGRGVPVPPALGGGPAQPVRRAGTPGWPSSPGDAALPRESRVAADGRRRLPGKEAGRRHLSRRPGRRPGLGSRHGPLGAARTADDGTDLGAGTQGLGHRPLVAVLGLVLLPDLLGGTRPAMGVHVGPARGDAGAGRRRRLRRRGEGQARLATQDERAAPATPWTTPGRPGSCATAPMCRRAGREMCTRSPGPSPTCWPSRPDAQLPSRTRSKASGGIITSK